MPDSLDALAQVKGFSGFGSSMGAGATASEGGSLSFNDAGVRAIQRRECGILVCETEMKGVALRGDPKEYTFYQADRMVDWARDNHMLMRGHTLLWNQPHPGYTPIRSCGWLHREHLNIRGIDIFPIQMRSGWPSSCIPSERDPWVEWQR